MPQNPTTPLPAGWTHETNGPGNDGWYNDALPLCVLREAPNTDYAVANASDGSPAGRTTAYPRYATLEDAIRAAERLAAQGA